MRRRETHREEKARLWGLPVPDGLKHGGSTRAAVIYGCDCELCLPSRRRKGEERLTATERGRRLRKRKHGEPVPPGVKHGIYAATTYGCPCDVCKLARREDRARTRNLWRKRATGDWADGVVIEGRKTTVVHWPPVGVGMWECPLCEEKFPYREG